MASEGSVPALQALREAVRLSTCGDRAMEKITAPGPTGQPQNRSTEQVNEQINGCQVSGCARSLTWGMARRTGLHETVTA